MEEKKSIYSIVLDAAPMVKNEPTVDSLLARSESIVTVPSVLSEIRDSVARARVETLLKPFLTVRSPSSRSLQFVIDFAKKSGDFSVLSRTDLEVIALTYEIECQRTGGQSLREFPGQKNAQGALKNEDTQRAGETNGKILAPLVEEDSSRTSSQILDQGGGAVGTESGNIVDNLQNLKIDKETSKDQPSEHRIKQISNPGPTQAPSPDRNGSQNNDSDTDDSDGWITPSNLKKHQAKDLNGSTAPISEHTQLQAGCMTSDFAMQNVLLQIGLNLLSPSFQRIRNIRTYILRCHACFHLVKDKDTTKQFCPRCGKPTLTRVSCSTNQKGDFRIHLRKNMQWNHRGDRYSIPKPVPGSANGKVGHGKGGGKGGWGTELILAEDQKEYQRAIKGRGGGGAKDLMDEDYLPGILTGDRGRAGGRPKVGAGRNVNAKKRVR